MNGSALTESALRLARISCLSADQRDAASALLLSAMTAPSADISRIVLEDLQSLFVRCTALEATNTALVAKGFRQRMDEQIDHEMTATSVPLRHENEVQGLEKGFDGSGSADTNCVRFTTNLCRRQVPALS